MKSILGMRVDTTNYDDTSARIVEWVQAMDRGHYVCVSNVHMCMESWDDATFQNIVNSADLVVPDGKPLVWAKHALGDHDARQVRGAYLTDRTCADAVKHGFSVGIYGGKQETIEEVAEILKARHHGLRIDYLCSPPFRPLEPEEKQRYVGEINASGVAVLLVGLGCPKQEKWMAEHQPLLNCTMLGIGAALDFISGKVKPAPEWMQAIGMEWFFRFLMEPRRLWKRYLKQNPRFMWHFMRQWISYRFGQGAPGSAGT